MSGRNSNDWRGPRKSTRDNEREAAAAPSWKKSQRGAAVSGRPTKRRRWRLLVPLIFLIVLVALGIRIFAPDPLNKTHFVVLNLLENSVHFDSAAPPQFSEVRSSKRQQSLVDTPAALNFFDSADDSVCKSDVVIIFLQTQIVAGLNGDYWCLIKNSTPDLKQNSSGSPEFESLSVLKNELLQFRDVSEAPVLLIVDQPNTFQDRRLGALDVDIFDELQRWQKDEKLHRLVVMSSCSAGETSQPAYVGSGGQTAFAHIVSHGLSAAADGDGNGLLHVAELCQFVVQDTSNWARQHRAEAGQTVQVSPSIEDLKSTGNFLVMKDLPEPQTTLVFRRDSTTPEKIRTVWQTRTSLDAVYAWRWDPVDWQAGTELLLRSQEAMLDGNSALAGQLADSAAAKFNRLQAKTTEIVTSPDQLNLESGLPRKWFSGVLGGSYLNDLWENAEEIRPIATELAEDVVVEHLASYPFSGLQIPAPNSDTGRALAESAAARTMGVTSALRHTIKATESRQLRKEDMLFAHQHETDASTVPNLTEDWRAIQRFAELHQAAELELHRVLLDTESLSRWAADFPLSMSENFYSEWRNLLKKNLPNRNINAALAEELATAAVQLCQDREPGINGQALELKSDIFQLLVAGRVLGTQLHPDEPETGFTTGQLDQFSDELDRWLRLSFKCRERVAKNLNDIASNLARHFVDRAKQVQAYQWQRATLRCSLLTDETRHKLLNSLQDLEAELSNAEGGEIPQSEMPFYVSQIDIGLWHLQHLNLLRGSSQDSALTEVAEAVVSLASAGNADQQHVAAYGRAIREFWRNVRNDARDSLNASGNDAEQRLRIADLRARSFSAFDDPGRSPTVRLHALWQINYCLQQADRRLQSQWVRTGESGPWDEKGWYARESKAWLQIAEALASKMDTSGIPPAFVSNSIEQRKIVLQDSADWSIVATPVEASFDIGEQNQPRQAVQSTLQRISRPNTDGLATLRFLTESTSDAAALVTFEENGKAFDLNSNVKDLVTNVVRNGSPGEEGCSSVPYSASVFFRGRIWNTASNIEVSPCAAEEFVVQRFARPPTASVTLAGSDKRPIVFILDMSGSMDDEMAGGRTRASVAVETLRNVINSARFDRETVASLKVFGHRIKWDPENQQNVVNPKWKEPFDKGLAANGDIATEVEAMRLTTENKTILGKKLDTFAISGPWGITPLAGAIKSALEEDLRNRTGIVVAITDGLATDVGLDSEANPANVDNRINKLKEAIDNNSSSKVVIVALDFIPGAPQRKALQTVFVEQCGIEIVDAANQIQLLDQIEQSLDPRQYLVTRSSEATNIQKDFGETAQGLKAGTDYVVKFADIVTADNKPITLNDGDALNLAVDWNDRKFTFVRGKESEMRQRATAARPGDSDAPTILRAIEPATFTEYKREQNLSEFRQVEVSLMLDHERRDRPVKQPAEINFNIVSEDSLPLRCPEIEEQFTSEWGAPGWRLKIAEWPANKYVRIDAVWKMERTAPELVIDCPPVNQSKTVIGGVQDLPQMEIATTVRPDGTLRIRLDRIPSMAYSADNLIEDIRVEVGAPDLRGRNEAFMPAEVTTTVRQTNSGSLVVDFAGNFTEETLAEKKIAFTSRKALERGAMKLARPLTISETIQRKAAE